MAASQINVTCKHQIGCEGAAEIEVRHAATSGVVIFATSSEGGSLLLPFHVQIGPVVETLGTGVVTYLVPHLATLVSFGNSPNDVVVLIFGVVTLPIEIVGRAGLEGIAHSGPFLVRAVLPRGHNGDVGAYRSDSLCIGR